MFLEEGWNYLLRSWVFVLSIVVLVVEPASGIVFCHLLWEEVEVVLGLQWRVF